MDLGAIIAANSRRKAVEVREENRVTRDEVPVLRVLGAATARVLREKTVKKQLPAPLPVKRSSGEGGQKADLNLAGPEPRRMKRKLGRLAQIISGFLGVTDDQRSGGCNSSDVCKFN